MLHAVIAHFVPLQKGGHPALRISVPEHRSLTSIDVDEILQRARVWMDEVNTALGLWYGEGEEARSGSAQRSGRHSRGATHVLRHTRTYQKIKWASGSRTTEMYQHQECPQTRYNCIQTANMEKSNQKTRICMRTVRGHTIQ